MVRITPAETEFIMSTLLELKGSEHYNPEGAAEIIEQAFEILEAAYNNAEDVEIPERGDYECNSDYL